MLPSGLTGMNIQRTAKFVVVGAVAAVWLAAAATSGGRADRQPVGSTVPPVDPRATVLASEIARLHERQAPATPPRQPSRNLFSFARIIRRAGSGEAAQPAQRVQPIPEPLPPPLKLSGIGEDTTPAGIVRTAIISGSGELFLAKEGDTVAARYRVSKISSDVVELVDVSDGTVRRLVFQ